MSVSTPVLGRGLLRADSLIDQADELLRQGLLLPAVMTARAAIEVRLRQLAHRAGLRRMFGPNPRKAHVNGLSIFLLSKGILNRQQYDDATRLYGRLSKLTHGNLLCFYDGQRLIAAVRQIIGATAKGGAV